MAQLLAGIWADTSAEDYRVAARRTLRLELPVSAASQPEATVLIRDLSEMGFMIETSVELAVGETFQIDLPEAGLTDARVIWNRESFFGCKFLSRVSKGAVSAALLRTPVEQFVASDHRTQSANWLDFADDIFLDETSPRNHTVVMISLALLSIVVLLFMYAMLSLPFSPEQLAP